MGEITPACRSNQMTQLLCQGCINRSVLDKPVLFRQLPKPKRQHLTGAVVFYDPKIGHCILVVDVGPNPLFHGIHKAREHNQEQNHLNAGLFALFHVWFGGPHQKG